MSKFDPDAYLASRETPFDPDQYLKSKGLSTIEDGPSEIESLLRGGAQGISFGLADEATGALESMLTDKSYEQARDESRAAYDEASRVNPVSYNVGQIGGAIGSSFVPGLGALNAAKGASLGTIAAKGALQGALQGLGDSTKDNAQDVALDGLKGAAIGGVVAPVASVAIPKSLEVAKKGFNKLGDYADYADDATNLALKKIGKTVASIPENVTDRYLERSDFIKEVPELDEIGHNFIEKYLPGLQTQLSKMDDNAWRVLDTNPNISKENILNEGTTFYNSILGGKNDTFTRTLGVGADADRLKVVQNTLKEIESAYGETLSESDLKSVVQSLQKLGWSLEGNPKTSVQADTYQKLSGVFNDILKRGNPEYAVRMEPVQKLTQDINIIKSRLINQQMPNEVEKFVQKVKRWDKDISTPEKSAIMRRSGSDVDGLAEEISTIANPITQVKDRLALDAFSKDSTAGSRKTLIGGALGTFGGPVGTALGGAAGFVGDKYGGKLFQGVLDGKIGMQEFLSKYGPALGEKFSKALNDASQRGTAALASVHFLLSNNNQEYREKIKQLNEGE